MFPGSAVANVFPRRARFLILCAIAGMMPATPLLAADLDATRINEAVFAGKSPPADAIAPVSVKLQVLLDRASFSPGEIDGKLGTNTQKALQAFAEAQQLPSTTKLTQEVWKALASDTSPVLTEYTITETETRGPFLPKLPPHLDDMKELPALSYTSPREGLAEKFHVSEALLAALNPGKSFDAAGTRIIVPDVTAPDREAAAVATVEVDKQRETVRALDGSGRLIAFYPATVGSEEKPSPTGTLKVTAITNHPTYRYDPKYHFKDVHSTKPFTIKPGPNNPVGTVWIALNAEGYGIHGTPNPANISKADSHGCVRLTNWDAERLARSVKRGVVVAFVESTEANAGKNAAKGDGKATR
jgi:lipoprotein-anchoring transpeptidase ErfK/SrfK